jgi:hypothetical protein
LAYPAATPGTPNDNQLQQAGNQVVEKSTELRVAPCRKSGTGEKYFSCYFISILTSYSGFQKEKLKQSFFFLTESRT